MATSWNPSDLSGVTLSGSNLTATSTGATTYVRSVDRTYAVGGTNKVYWEVRPTVFANTSTGFGFAPSALVNPNGTSVSGFCAIFRTGVIWLNGSSTGITLGAIAAGTTIGIALDPVAKRVWFRIAPAGNWNASGTANPATNVGGIDVSAVLTVDAMPVAAFGQTAEAVVANFGDTAFSGTIPSGFVTLPLPPGGNAQIDGIAREVLITGTGWALLSNVVREALVDFPGIIVEAGGVVRETLGAKDGVVAVAGLVRETVCIPAVPRHDTGVAGLVRETVGKLPPRLIQADQLIPDFAQTVRLLGKARITVDQTVPAFPQTFTLRAPVHINAHQTIPDFDQVHIYGKAGLVFDQTIPPFTDDHHYHVRQTAAGGGGGGAAGLFGIGEDGQAGRGDGIGGYGGAADDDHTPRQTTSGSTGNTGTEWDGTYGSGSGGSGGDWGDTSHGANGGTGGQYGGGGGGGGAGLADGGLGALGGEGAIFLQYDPGTGPIVILLTHDSVGPFVFPEDWTDNNIVLLIGAGGCGANGTLTVGGDGGGGGGAIGIINATLYSPGEVLDFYVPSAAEVCAGTDTPDTVFGGHAAAPGINGDGTGGGTSVPYEPTDGETVIDYDPGNGGPGGDMGIVIVPRQTHVLIVAG